MAQFMYYPATKVFNNIPLNIKNLVHDIQGFIGTILEVPIMLRRSLRTPINDLLLNIQE